MADSSSQITIPPPPGSTEVNIRRAIAGDKEALAALVEAERERLRRMVRLRLDRRLSARIGYSDFIQEVHLEASKRMPDYARDPTLPFHLWLRLIANQKLIDLHRQHLGTQMRDAHREISLHRGAYPQASSVSLAAQLLGHKTSASQAAMRAEHKLMLQEALNSMDPIDREVLTLRHFEHLSNDETALVLGLSKAAASNRHVRAMRRLAEVLATIPGFKDFHGK